MQTIIFATNNPHKVDEIKAQVGDAYNIFSLKDAGIDIEIPEPHNTLEENAVEKSTTIYNLTKQNCFSEDTGLEVEALNGEPGVWSARYAANGNNIEKLLKNLEGKENRKARFRTVISLVFNQQSYFFEGICKGTITTEPIGANGFGYDPIFIPDGSFKTFAQMTRQDKITFSHRQKAASKLLHFLSQNGTNPSLK